MIIRWYRLNARPYFYFIWSYLLFFIYLFIFIFIFIFFFFWGGGGFQRIRKQVYVLWICIIYNTYGLSMIALWVNMFTRLWISIFSVMAVHYDYPWYNYGYPSRDNSNLYIQTLLWISLIQSWISIIIGFIRTFYITIIIFIIIIIIISLKYLDMLQSNITRYWTQKIWSDGRTKGVFFFVILGKDTQRYREW